MSSFRHSNNFKSGCANSTLRGSYLRRISGQHADRGAERIVNGSASQLDIVAALYDYGSHVRQLEAALYVTAHVVADFSVPSTSE